MNRLDRICESIMWREGCRPGSRSYRTCNPGNLRWSKWQSGNEEGYAVFETLADGWSALVFDVQAKATGRTQTGLTPDSTIQDFVKVYAPSGDANNPEIYCRDICARARVNPTDTLGSLLLSE